MKRSSMPNMSSRPAVQDGYRDVGRETIEAGDESWSSILAKWKPIAAHMVGRFNTGLNGRIRRKL